MIHTQIKAVSVSVIKKLLSRRAVKDAPRDQLETSLTLMLITMIRM